MSEVHVDRGPAEARSGVTADVEREVTKRAMIEAVKAVVLVVLYMAFTFLRDREPGVVSLDGADDWQD